jgi:2-polyprenyl-3-methyl-5-hydroxy-6-metoxy-1,4-benzoquinol methylase
MILEIGPGECELAELLVAEHGFANLSVLDMSPEVIALAESLGIAATLTDDTTAHLASTGQKYDAIVLLHVLEHVPKELTIALLSSIRHALRDGGRLLVEVPNMGDPLNGLYFRYADFTHEVGFTEESLSYVLRQAGFEEIDFLEQAGASRPALRMLQRATRAVLHGLLYVLNLPNGRQMRRRIGPVLSACATV